MVNPLHDDALPLSQSDDQNKDPLHGHFSDWPLTGAALCLVIAQQVYYSTMLAQQGI